VILTGGVAGKTSDLFTGAAGLKQLSVLATFTAPEIYGFRGRITNAQLGTAHLSVATLSEVTIDRSIAHINRSPMDSLIVTLILDGGCRVHQSRRGTNMVTAAAGDLLVRLSDQSHMMTVQDGTTMVEVSLPLPSQTNITRPHLAASSVPDSELSLEIVRLLLDLSTFAPVEGSSEGVQAEQDLLDIARRLVARLGTTPARGGLK